MGRNGVRKRLLPTEERHGRPRPSVGRLAKTERDTHAETHAADKTRERKLKGGREKERSR